MPIAQDQPDRRAVEDFLLGRLADNDADLVAAYLESDPRWQALAASSETSDALLQAVQSATPLDQTEAPAELVARLEGLRAALHATPTTAFPSGTASPLPATLDFSFLRPAEQPGDLGQLGGFRVLRLIGAGGMGMVFEAGDPGLDRRVALKVMRPERAADPGHRQRFLREARAAAGLRHDHIIPIYQVGEDQGTPFLAMPLLKGESLESLLRRDSKLPITDVFRLGREIAEGLAAAHAAGLVHRDIKPANIWLEAVDSEQWAVGRKANAEFIAGPLSTRRVQILDFGLARAADDDSGITQSGMIVGTPSYMSPEQADGKPLDARSDLFSLGCVLYRMTTGDDPFRGPTLTATLRAVVEHQPPPPHECSVEVPRPLSDLIMALLAKSPGERPPSAQAVAAALTSLERGDASTMAFAMLGAGRRSRRWLVPGLAAAAVALIAVLSIVVVVILRRDSTELPPGPNNHPPPKPTAYQGYVDLLVWRGEKEEVRKIRIDEPGVMPLRAGDKIRIEAKVTPTAYLYLFWIDTEGKVEPVYPWKPRTPKDKDWNPRPKEETPREELSLPPSLGKVYTIDGDQQGMETLLLMARPTRLDADDDQVKSWFADLGPQRPIQDHGSVVWFENGKILRTDPRRRSVTFNEEDINDPALRLQGLVHERLQPHAAFTTAVSFAVKGK